LDISGGDARVESEYSWLTDSDIRFKKNITRISGAISALEKVRGVRFELKDVPDGEREHIGVIAQELETVYPELVATNKDTGMKAVAYDKLTAVLIEAVKELKAENEELRKRIEQLEEH
jgi:hypothetical protein